MADVAIDTGLEPRAYGVGKRIGPIWVSETVGYAFFITSSANSGAGPLKYRKTTDSGATWAAAVTIEAGNCGPFSVWYDKETNGDTGTKIHVAFSDWDNNRMYWISLDTSGDTLATKVQISTTVGGFGFATSYVADGFSTITKARSGDIYVGAGQGDGTSGFWVSANGGTTWTSKTSPGEGDQNDLFQLMPAGDSDSADIACVYLDDTAHELSFKLYDASANTWGNETSIATALNNNVDWPDAYWGFDVAVRHSDNKAIVVYWNYEDNAAADLSACVLTLTAAGANATALTALLSNTVEAGECTVMINGNNDDIYVAYCKGGTWDSLTDVWYKLSTDDGSTWGTATQMNTTQDDIRNVHSMSIVASGQAGRWQPVWPNDDLNDLITNNGLSVSISGGGGTTTRRYSLSLTGVG